MNGGEGAQDVADTGVSQQQEKKTKESAEVKKHDDALLSTSRHQDA